MTDGVYSGRRIMTEVKRLTVRGTHEKDKHTSLLTQKMVCYIHDAGDSDTVVGRLSGGRRLSGHRCTQFLVTFLFVCLS